MLAVVLYHFAPGLAPGGFLGVDLFFVLSGFLITSLLVNEWESTGRISLPAFWGRRARRLLPALFVVLGAVAVYTLELSNRVEGHRVAGDGLSALLYVANWHFIASGQGYIQQFLSQAPSPLRHMWSLAIEEQFYLLWPILVLGLARLVGGRVTRAGSERLRFRHVLGAMCAVMGVVSLLRMVTLYHSSSDLNRVYYGTDARAFIILVGATLGALTAGVPTLTGRWRRALIVAGCAGALALSAVMAGVTITSAWLYHGGYGLIAITMVVVLAAAAQVGRNPLARLLGLRPLVGLGLISYGVYLWHWPVFLWVTESNTGTRGVALFVVRALITLAASLTSFFLVELPIRRGGLSRLAPLTRSLAALLPASVVAVMLVIPALTYSSVAAAPTTRAPTRALATTDRYVTAPRCDVGAAVTPIKPGRRLLVDLEGNSIGGEIHDCVAAILRSRNARLESGGGYVQPCDALPGIAAQARNPAKRPDAAILFAFVMDDSSCGSTWHWVVDQLVATWKAAGVHTYLVPSVPFVPGSPRAGELGRAPLIEAAYYQSLAAQDPARVTVLDAGTFLRDPDGQYGWRMPCVPGGEPGCDSNRSVGVRYQDGFHFCTDPAFAAHGCAGAQYEAGERRAAASVAAALIPSLATLPLGPPHAT